MLASLYVSLTILHAILVGMRPSTKVVLKAVVLHVAGSVAARELASAWLGLNAAGVCEREREREPVINEREENSTFQGVRRTYSRRMEIRTSSYFRTPYRSTEEVCRYEKNKRCL